MKKFFMFLLLIQSFFFSKAYAAADEVYERVMDSGVIRCGYIIYPPQLSKDPNTQQLSGLAYDLMERIGKDLNLKIEWKEEVSAATYIEGLRTGRYDALCNTAWTTTIQAPHTLTSIPVFFTAVNAYARKNDHRFDKNIDLINSPDIKIATIDGATSASIALLKFPLAKTVSLPDTTDFSQLLLEVSNKKADVTFSEAAQFEDFNTKVPNRLRNITPDVPVQLVQNAFFVKAQEYQLISMINLAVQNLHNEGFVEKLLNKYEPRPNVWKRVAKPYPVTQ